MTRVERLFELASLSYDRFPSLSQLNELAEKNKLKSYGSKRADAMPIEDVNCECRGLGYFHCWNEKRRSESIFSCGKCARGIHLKMRENHPIMDEDLANGLGYFRMKNNSFIDKEIK